MLYHFDHLVSVFGAHVGMVRFGYLTSGNITVTQPFTNVPLQCLQPAIRQQMLPGTSALVEEIKVCKIRIKRNTIYYCTGANVG